MARSGVALGRRVPAEALLALLAHVPPGRNLREVEDGLARHRAGQRIVALVS